MVPLPAAGQPAIDSFVSCLSHLSTSFDRQTLFEEFRPLICRLIRQYAEGRDMQADLAGDLYCRFCEFLDAYDPGRGIPLRAYLVRQLSSAAYTCARRAWRIRRRELSLEEPAGFRGQLAADDPTPSWLRGLECRALMASLPALIDRLPARQRQVVIWRYLEGRSFTWMAEQTGTRPATARSLLRFGLASLRKLARERGLEGPV